MSAVTPGTAPPRRVRIRRVDQNGRPYGRVIRAQFNPTSLQYTIQNSAPQGSSRGQSRAVGESTGKLTMDLVYDTTDSGKDVRNKTQRIAMLMKPGGGRQTPVVDVRWGDFKFRGVLDSYRETIDFFSPEGRPLRASLSLGFSTVTEQNRTPDEVFAFSSNKQAVEEEEGGFQATDQAFTYEVPQFRGMSTTQAATGLGAPGSGNRLAALNGIEDPRNGTGAPDTLLVTDEPTLDEPLAFSPGGGGGAAAAFGTAAEASFGANASFGASASFGAGAAFGASAGAMFGASAEAGAAFGANASAGDFAGAGASFSTSAGASASSSASAGASAGGFAGAGGFACAGASFSASASASASASGFAGAGALFSASAGASTSARAGSAASAGVAASAGAFAALRPPPPPVRQRFEIRRVFELRSVPAPPVDDPIGFGRGGIALRTGGNTVDVGQRVSLRDLIEFEE